MMLITFARTISLARVGLLFTMIGLVTLANGTWAESPAKSIFESLRNQVYQIRVIDIASGDKYSIGSGFQVSDAGHIATNFHVVSSFVHEPEKYRLELVKDGGAIQALNLLAIDVIHDLALIKAEGITGQPLKLSPQLLNNGDRIFSMGNPHDLGMTIIEGTYNGFVQHVRHHQILFSGSLNAGMSGGPALNAAGEVIGVNVSKGGEQISFLVPVKHLQKLLEETLKAPQTDFNKAIRDALLEDQDSFFSNVVARDYERETLGEVKVPVNLAKPLKCWGHTQDGEKSLSKGVHQHCRSEDRIFISDELYVGYLFYDYEWMTTEKLNPFQFYSAVEERFEHRGLNNSYDEKEVSPFECFTRRVAMTEHRWKVSSCLRAYIKYPGLYDASMVMASVDGKDKSLVVKLGATAISRRNAAALIKYVMEGLQWNP